MGRYNGSGPSGGYYNRIWIFFLLLLTVLTELSWCYKEKVRGGGGTGGGSKYGGGVVGGGFRGGAASSAVVAAGPGGQGEQREYGMSNNKIGEPSCDELRAMWRYHRRQSRAELTNQIPAFEPLGYWEFPSAVTRGGGASALSSSGGESSFGTLRKSHSRDRSKPYRYGGSGGGHHGGYGGYRDPYGHINFFGPSTPRQLRPMEQLMRAMPPKQPPASAVEEPTVHFSPPPTQSPPTQSSLQQLQQIYLEQQRARLSEEGGGQQQGPQSEFGTLVLSPPTGQDGRVANKPKALMTPFEKIRFGHADFQGILPETMKRGLFYYPMRTSRLRPSSSDGVIHHHQRPASSAAAAAAAAAANNNNNPPLTTTASTSSSSSIFSSSSTTMVPTYPSLPQAPLPSVFSFWRRQLLPQEPPPSSSIVMDQVPPSCSLVQGLQCTLNQHCSCQGNGLYRCFLGQCHFLSLKNAVEDDETSRGTWHTGPIIENQLGLWEQQQQQQQQQLLLLQQLEEEEEQLQQQHQQRAGVDEDEEFGQEAEEGDDQDQLEQIEDQVEA